MKATSLAKSHSPVFQCPAWSTCGGFAAILGVLILIAFLRLSRADAQSFSVTMAFSAIPWRIITGKVSGAESAAFGIRSAISACRSGAMEYLDLLSALV